MIPNSNTDEIDMDKVFRQYAAYAKFLDEGLQSVNDANPDNELYWFDNLGFAWLIPTKEVKQTS